VIVFHDTNTTLAFHLQPDYERRSELRALVSTDKSYDIRSRVRNGASRR
jgi:hypothetical protein